MGDADRGRGDREAAARPAWVDKPDQGEQEPPDQSGPGRIRAVAAWREPAGTHPPLVPADGGDGLWVHVTEVALLVAAGTVIAAVIMPHPWPWWQITTAAAAVTLVAGYTALVQARSLVMAGYLTAWGVVLTAWITAARISGPWHESLFGLLLAVLVLIPAGVTVIRGHRDMVRRAAGAGRDTVNIRECRYWEDLLTRFGVQGVDVRDVLQVEGGRQVHCRLGKFTLDGRRPTGIEGVRELSAAIAQHRRLPKGAVYVEEEPAGGSAADFIIHVRSVAGPRLARWLPAENSLLSVNRAFSLGVFDSGREFKLKLREVVVFICGLRGSGKSTLLNVFIAQLCRMPDALIFMIDLKGGQEARAWLMPWLQGQTDRPAIDWLATTREEADIMLDALKRAGYARAESGRHGKKLRPSPEHPAIIPLCDETTVMTGHAIREDNLSNTKLAVKLLQIAETFRSVGIDPVIAAVRAVVDATGKSGIKAMADVRIGMRVATADEGRMVFPDNLAAARQLAQLKDKGTGIPKVGSELHPPVHFYNITDGEPDDDGHPTEDRITPVVLATAARRPKPEQLIRDAMGEAYAKRWEQPHIRQLTDTWLREAGEARPAEPADAGGDPFDVMVRADPLLSELGPMMDELGPPRRGDDDDERLHPARKRMRHLLIGRGREGWKPDDLWHQLLSEGHTCARETMHRWLAKDEKKGYVYRTGKPRSRWIWRLPEGAEFEIPGMDT